MNTTLVTYYIIGIVATCIVAACAYVLASRHQWSVPRWFLIGIIVVVPVLLLALQVLKYSSLHMYIDFSHWLDILQGIIRSGKPLSLDVELQTPGRYNYFSSHFVPLLYFVAAPFVLFPHPYTVITFNVLVMCTSVIPLYLLARRMGGNQGFALLCVALLLWYPTVQYVVLYEFEMLRFSIPILFWMLYFWERRRIAAVLTFALLASFVREEAGLTVALFGLSLAIMSRRRALGGMIFALGIGAFMFILYVAMPAAWSDGRFAHGTLSYFGAGAGPVAVAMDIVRHPLTFLATVGNPVKLANLAMLFLPLLFIPLLSPVTLLPVLASFGIALLSISEVHSSYMLYYIAPSVPFLFYAFLKAWPRLTAFLLRRTPGISILRLQNVLACAALAGMLTANIFFGPSPISLQFWSNRFRPAPFRTQSFHWSVYRVTDHHRAVNDVIAHIPDDAIVSTQQFLTPRLSRVRGVMEYPQLMSRDGQYRAEYVLLDITNNDLSPASPAYASEADLGIVRNDAVIWERIIEANQYELYRRR